MLLTLLALASYACLVLFVKHVFQALRAELPLADMAFVYACGHVSVSSLTLVPGGIARLVLVTKLFHFTYRKAVQIWIMESALSALLQAFLVCLGVFFFSRKALIFLLAIILGIIGGYLAIKKLTNWFAKATFTGGQFLAPYLKHWESLCEAISTSDRLSLCRAAFFYLLSSFGKACIYWILLYQFGSSANIILIWSITGLSFWAGFLSQIPMGLGAKDVTSFLLFRGAVGLGDTEALTAVVIMRLFSTVLPLLLSLIIANSLSGRYGDDQRGCHPEV